MCSPPPILCGAQGLRGKGRRDGRLQEGDQILAIDGQPLDSNISHQQAISILQQAREARGTDRGPGDRAHLLPHSRVPGAVAVRAQRRLKGSDMVVSTLSVSLFGSSIRCYVCDLRLTTITSLTTFA
ncbi:hypothetical protein CDAR_584311 [Caerostris darwini]|uniref:PDZ domain-containing protein n=1 Tax=Caerostris darwini TaxID=1538125 RepID=A0AAV4WEU1_9ARAC|nr:hypothetical protein CDAR_584311 [Caerostris darwini]